jgi:hypothetical protein
MTYSEYLRPLPRLTIKGKYQKGKISVSLPKISVSLPMIRIRQSRKPRMSQVAGSAAIFGLYSEKLGQQ